MPVEAGQRYSLSLYMRAPHGPPPNATVSLLSGGDAPATLATASFDGIGPEWQRFDAELVSSATDWQASLRVRRASLAGVVGSCLFDPCCLRDCRNLQSHIATATCQDQHTMRIPLHPPASTRPGCV